MKRPLPKKINQRKVNGATVAKLGCVFCKTNLHHKIREFRPAVEDWLKMNEADRPAQRWKR
jgi:hypothetical protein